MDNSQWKLLKERLFAEVQDVLAPLESENWGPEVNRKANNLLSKRAERLMVELNLPKIPEGHRLFAKIWFNGRVSPPKLKLSVYHVPWQKGGSRATRTQPVRKPIASPLKAEDPLGVIQRADNIMCRYDREFVMNRLHSDADQMLDDPMELKEVRRFSDYEQASAEAHDDEQTQEATA